jgi:hypothetical protein
MFHFDNVSISSTVLTVVQHSVYREMNVATSNIGVMVWGRLAIFLIYLFVNSVDTTCHCVCETYLVYMAF